MSQWSVSLTFNEARRRPDWPEWDRAIRDELEALKRNATYSTATLRPGKRAIGSKFVIKRKLNSDGSLERYKARLCAKGYSQIQGLDFFETTAPVAKINSVKILLSIAAHGHMEANYKVSTLIKTDLMCLILNSLV